MIGPYAVAAFANGYAEVPGAPQQWTPSIRDASDAAVAVAEAHADRTGVLEAVRRTGRKAALYHAVDARHDALLERLQGEIRPHMTELLRIAAPMIVHQLSMPGMPREAIADPPPVGQTRGVAQQVLDSLAAQEAYQAWLGLTAEGLLEGTAVGRAGAVMWLAHERGQILPSWNLTFQNALERLRYLPGDWHDPSTWMGRQTHGLAYQMGGELADAIAAGASRDELLSIIEEISGDPWAANSVLDYAVSSASSAGAIDLYRSEGLEWVAILVSPDACVECDGLDAEPYMLGTEPYIPQHPRCRCSYSPVVSTPDQAYG